jgi:hypothetical protein
LRFYYLLVSQGVSITPIVKITLITVLLPTGYEDQLDFSAAIMGRFATFLTIPLRFRPYQKRIERIVRDAE